MLGNFDIYALDNAFQKVETAIKNARIETDELCKIQNKTFMNFVRPLADINTKLSKITSPIYHLDAVNNSDDTQKIMSEILPILSEYSSDMAHHKPTYEAFVYIRENDWNNLNDEQKSIVTDSIKSFEISGINLPIAEQEKLKEISSTLSLLSNQFSNNIIAANKLNKITISDETLLGNMPQSDKDCSKTDSGWEFGISGPDYSKFMKYVIDDNLRLTMHKNNLSRAPENEDIISQILKLRGEESKILGYKNYADMALEFRDAENADDVINYLNNLSDKTMDSKRDAYKELCEFAGLTIPAHSTAFYTKKYESEKLSVSESEIKPYFELHKTTDKVLNLLGDMFGIKFEKRAAKIWNENVLYFDVIKNDRTIGGLYLDLIVRDNKSPGAWMDPFAQHHINAKEEEILPECVVVTNFAKPTDTSPSLLTLGDIGTLFHEMGHALHFLLSRVAELDSNDIDWDVIEFPSRFLEFLSEDKSITKQISEHYITGDKIPDSLLERIDNLNNYEKRWGMNLAYDFFDMELHTSNEYDKEFVQSVANSTKSRFSLFPKIEYDKFQNTFSHIFAGAYAAGYYSYMWADKFAGDALAEYKSATNKSEFMEKYTNTVCALGASKPMRDIYKDFTGHAPDINNLLKYYNIK